MMKKVWKTELLHEFSKCKGRNSAKNQWTRTIFKLDYHPKILEMDRLTDTQLVRVYHIIPDHFVWQDNKNCFTCKNTDIN